MARLDRFRWQSAGIAPWLFRIAANELTDHFRRQSRRRGDRARRAADRLADHVAIDDLDHLDTSAELERMRSALQRINLRYERALTLRYLSGLDHDDAAKAMGVTPKLMAVIVHRATVTLRKQMEGTAQADGRNSVTNQSDDNPLAPLVNEHVALDPHRRDQIEAVLRV